MDLPGQDQRIDHGAAVVHHDVFANFDREGLGIDLDDDGVHAARGGARRRAEVLGRLEARLSAGPHRAAHRVRHHGEIAERH